MTYLVHAPFNLFCEKISNNEKQIIATTIRNFNPPNEYKLGKPKKVTLPKSRVLATRLQLSDFVKNESHFVFDVLNFDKTWLDLPFSEWSLHEGYIELKNFVNTMLVTNDAAERGIRIASNYIDILTKDASERQDLLQTVEYTRKKMVDAKKTTVQASYNTDFNMEEINNG